jgi:putative ubiquitin-RnfH superfamily antitoxin RatB of RatAB toxin-antitoxin module
MANADCPLPAAGGEPAAIVVELAWSPAPREMHTCTLSLARGATIADALRASGWPGLPAAAGEGGGLATAVRGRLRPLDHPLADGDRVELLRGLAVDPMEARRARFEAAGGVKALRRRKHAAQAAKARRISGSSGR